MKSKKDIELRLEVMKGELDNLFKLRDNSDKQWMYQEYCLQICSHCDKMKLLEWVLE